MNLSNKFFKYLKQSQIYHILCYWQQPYNIYLIEVEVSRYGINREFDFPKGPNRIWGFPPSPAEPDSEGKRLRAAGKKFISLHAI